MFTVIVKVINVQAQMPVFVEEVTFTLAHMPVSGEEVTVMLANLPVSGEKGTAMLAHMPVFGEEVTVMLANLPVSGEEETFTSGKEVTFTLLLAMNGHAGPSDQLSPTWRRDCSCPAA